MLYGHTAYSSIQQKMRVRMRVQEYINTAAFTYSIQQKNCCMLLYGGHTADDSIQQIPMISGVARAEVGGLQPQAVGVHSENHWELEGPRGLKRELSVPSTNYHRELTKCH